ncbi:MAG: GatB/YqeY domain-containing protein [Thermodesulfobacteriota bacterium]
MGLRDQIPGDLKNALRAKKSLELNVLRMLQASIKNKEIDNKSELNDGQVVEVVSSEIKKRRDAVEEFIRVNREDAAELEKQEIEILMKYMPEQLSEEEITGKVREIIDNSEAGGMKDLGMVMKPVMTELKGKADGKLINQIVRKELENLENN